MKKLKTLCLLFLLNPLSEARPKSTMPPVPFNANVEELLSRLKAEKITTLTQSIQLLDKKYFRTGNYALIFNSQSIQPSSLTFPRVLLFGDKTHLRLGFNHRLGKERDLEVIQWREKEKVWEFREIKFTKSGVKMSKANPSLCIQCHDTKKPKFNSHFLSRYTNTLSGSTNRDSFKKVRAKDKIYSQFIFPVQE